MMQDYLAGFLVVLCSPEERNPRNVDYLGIDRVPEYPPTDALEAKAMDEYVFGDYKNPDTNLIPTFELANKLLSAFAASPRKFEVIFCCEGPDCPYLRSLDAQKKQELGFDVTGLSGDYWSIVGDIPDVEWTEAYKHSLNSFGLFNTREEAQRFLNDYREHREADWDSSFKVIYVVKVAGDV